MAEGIAGPDRADFVLDNARDLALGAGRSFIFVLFAVGLIWAISARRIGATLGAALIVAAAAIDIWTVERSYWMFSPPADQLYASDETIRYLNQQPQPARVIPIPLSADFARTDPFLRPGGQANGLMSHDVRSVLGYHGNQLGRYNDLLGMDEGGRQIGNPNLWALTNARFFLTNTDSLPIPGARRVVGPTRDAAGTTVYLYALPGDNPIAWVAPVIVKAAPDAVLSTVLDPRFDVKRAALFDSSAAVNATSISALPEPLPVKVSSTLYAPGHMTLSLDTPAPEGSALVVSENYYPGWQATVDGRPGDRRRARTGADRRGAAGRSAKGRADLRQLPGLPHGEGALTVHRTRAHRPPVVAGGAFAERRAQCLIALWSSSRHTTSGRTSVRSSMPSSRRTPASRCWWSTTDRPMAPGDSWTGAWPRIRASHVIHRPRKLGLGTAYVAGFRWALERDFAYIMEMDADFSHDPSHISHFLGEHQRAPTWCSAPDIANGKVTVVNWPMSRLILSYAANIYARVVTGLPLYDATGGFKCFRRKVLEAIDLNDVKSNGYAFQIEMSFRAWRKGFRIVEIPIVFVDRSEGESKMSGRIVREAIWMVWRLRWWGRPGGSEA